LGQSRVGIMGGTFDPIHYGHLVTAEVARHSFDLEVVIFVPAGRPPHKTEQRITDVEHRYLMTAMATVTNSCFEVSRVEIERPGPSYTIETMSEFRRRLGSQARLFFITGADAILEIWGWKDAQRLLKICEFIAATRPGYVLSGLETLLAQVEEPDRQRLHLLEVPALAISSSDIRERVRRGRPIKYLVPEVVENYIYKHGLYRD